MKSTSPKVAGTSIGLLAILLCGSALLPQAAAQSNSAEQKTFATPEEASQALVAATETYDVPALIEILGPDGKDLIASEDPVNDAKRAKEFAQLARARQSVVLKTPSRAALVVGEDEWPMPIPLVKQNGRWLFDSKAGRREVLYRRIGGNELDAIQVCRGYVEAQQEYAAQKHAGSDVNQYAQRIISTPGKQDGLVWRDQEGRLAGPIGEQIADAIQHGYTDKAQPFHGYYFKILKGQGPAAPLGEMDFVVNGVMIGGFALAAAPAQYRVTGVKTFIVSHDGIVYEKDLGPDTLKIFQSMDRYNPDKTWHRTDDEW